MFTFNKKYKKLKRQLLRLQEQDEILENKFRQLAERSLNYYETIDALIVFLNLQKHETCDNDDLKSKIEIQLKK